MKTGQIILRIKDEFGYHIIRKHQQGWGLTIEGYTNKPDNYLSPPLYYLPIDPDIVSVEFKKQGKTYKGE